MKLIIQIPCFNEEGTLAETLADLPRQVPGVDVVEWLIVDDGSSDRTVEVARACGADHVVSHTRNRGLAAAFMTGLDEALRLGADIVVNTDADNQYDASCIPSLIEPVLAGDADIVVGERPIEDVPEFSRLKKRLQRLGSGVVRRFSGADVADAASGFRAISREAALRLQVFGRYTYTLETIVQAGIERMAIKSVPISVNPQTRPSRLVRSMRQYVMRSAQTIVRSFVIYRPFRFFVWMAMIPLVPGLALAVRWLILFVLDDTYQSRLPSLVASGLLITVAMQLLMVAFLADTIAASRKIAADQRYLERRRLYGGPSPDGGQGRASGEVRPS